MADNFILKIRGQDWTVKLLPIDSFYRIYDEGIAALTNVETKEIIFNPEDLSLSTVIHELTHAYFSASHVISANLNPDQVEEVMCDVIGEFGPEIIRTGRKLTKYLKTLAKDL